MPFLFVILGIAGLFLANKAGILKPKGAVSTPQPGPSTLSTDVGKVSGLINGATQTGGTAVTALKGAASSFGINLSASPAVAAGNATKPSNKGLTSGAGGSGTAGNADNSGVTADDSEPDLGASATESDVGTDAFGDVGDDSSFGDDSSYLDDGSDDSGDDGGGD